MKYELLDSFFQFFSEHGMIEFESIFSKQDLNLLSSLIQSSLSKPPRQDPWQMGHNLWKKQSEIKKILFKSPVGEIASFLYKKKPIRLGYTQIISTHHSSPFPNPHTLEEISSITPIVGGALLCLSSSIEQVEKTATPNLSLPQSGRAFFFSSKTPIPFPDLYAHKDLLCILFCFVSTGARYKLNPLDIHTHALKRSGYAFGDLIGQEEAPFLFH